MVASHGRWWERSAATTIPSTRGELSADRCRTTPSIRSAMPLTGDIVTAERAISRLGADRSRLKRLPLIAEGTRLVHHQGEPAAVLNKTPGIIAGSRRLRATQPIAQVPHLR